MQLQPANFNILVVEDNPSDLYLIEQMLQASKIPINHIYSAGRIKDAIEILKRKDTGLVLLDLSLPDSLGIDSFLGIKQYAQKIPVIILTGQIASDVALEALKQNAQDYLVKGEFNASLLKKSIEYSIERKKAEEIILASEEKYKQMFYKNPFPMWINESESGRIIEVNDAALLKYGYERNEFLKLTLAEIQSPDDTYPSLDLSSAEQGGLWRHQKKNGEFIIVEFTHYPINYFGRTAIQVQINDVTEKISLENELELKKQQIIEAVLVAQETERKGIGEELHDNINQILTAVKLTLSVALKYPVKRTELLSNAITNIGMAVEEIRKLSKKLILFGNLKTFGLVKSVEELIADTLALTKLRITLDVCGLEEDSAGEEQKINIYRIIQEQMNNIIKYASASTVTINLVATGGQITLLMVDDGIGFDTSMPRKGIGLTNIISRAELFNGEVNIDSSPGNGCRLKVVLNAKRILSQRAA
jgi:two-component system, NarL family, sensor histidine kinase UhpB